MINTLVNSGHISLYIHENSEEHVQYGQRTPLKLLLTFCCGWLRSSSGWFTATCTLGRSKKRLNGWIRCVLCDNATDLPFDVAFAQECKHCILTRTHGTSISTMTRSPSQPFGCGRPSGDSRSCQLLHVCVLVTVLWSCATVCLQGAYNDHTDTYNRLC